jgi:flagellar hook-basal body complex protein FliE
MAIDPIGQMPIDPDLMRSDKRTGGESFAAAMGKYLREVNADQIKAADKIKALTVDGEGSIHDTMVAMSDAEGSFNLVMQMRNRLVEAVNRLLRPI